MALGICPHAISSPDIRDLTHIPLRYAFSRIYPLRPLRPEYRGVKCTSVTSNSRIAPCVVTIIAGRNPSLAPSARSGRSIHGLLASVIHGYRNEGKEHRLYSAVRYAKLLLSELQGSIDKKSNSINPCPETLIPGLISRFHGTSV